MQHVNSHLRRQQHTEMMHDGVVQEQINKKVNFLVLTAEYLCVSLEYTYIARDVCAFLNLYLTVVYFFWHLRNISTRQCITYE